MAVAVLVWAADALVRLPAQPVLTLVFYAWFCLRFVGTAGGLLREVGGNWVQFLFPIVCLASTAWSVSPQVSLGASVQIAFTVLVGLSLGAVFRPHALARLVAIALGLTMIASLANIGGALGVWQSYEGGFLGVYTNKNGLGQRGVLLMVACTYLLIADPSLAVRRAALAMLVLTAGLVAASLSATSIVVGMIACPMLCAAMLWQGTPRLRAPILVLALTGAACTLVALWFLAVDPWAALLDLFGKSHTLTGRTVLWEQAIDRIQAAPLLGTGAMAYWQAPVFAHETFVLQGRYGATVSAFHNFVLEILVMCGPLGLAAMAALIATALTRAAAVPGPERHWVLGAVMVLVFLALFGSSLFRQHEISLLLIAALAASCRHCVAKPGWRAPQVVPADARTPRPAPA